MDYFLFAESLAEMVQSEHLTLEDDLYAITEKGRRHGEDTESSLPYSVRLKCNRNLSDLNSHLRHAAQVRSRVTPRNDGYYTVRL